MNDLPSNDSVTGSSPALWGLGSGVAGAAAILVRSSAPATLSALPGSAPLFGVVAVPVVSLLALVGPTGLTFPCWAVDARSPGLRLWRWMRARVAA